MAIEQIEYYNSGEIAAGTTITHTMQIPVTLGTRTLVVGYDVGIINLSCSAGSLLQDFNSGSSSVEIPVGVTEVSLEATATDSSDADGVTIAVMADLRYEEHIITNLLGLPLKDIIEKLTETSNKLVKTVTPDLYFKAVSKGYVGTEDDFIQDILNGTDSSGTTQSSLYAVAQSQGYSGTLQEFAQDVLRAPEVNIEEIKNALLGDSGFTQAITNNLDLNVISNNLINNQEFINKVASDVTTVDAVAVTVSFDIKRANVIAIKSHKHSFLLFSTERLNTDTEVDPAELKTKSDIINFSHIE